MINVVVDIRDLQIATTGTKTFLEEVCKELERGHSGFQFYFLRLVTYTASIQRASDIQVC